MKLHRKALALGFLSGLVLCAVAWAATVDQIWNNVYDSANQAIRFTQVAP